MRILIVAATAAIALSLSGCASLGKVATQVAPIAAKVVNDAATIALTVELSKDPLTTKAKAVAFKAIAEQLLADATANPSVSLAQIEATFTAKLAAQAPNPIIALAITDFVGGFQGAINNGASALLGSSAAKPVAVEVAALANVVISVCSFYGA